jgi:hypothetical protein
MPWWTLIAGETAASSDEPENASGRTPRPPSEGTRARPRTVYRDYSSVSEKINGGQLLAPRTRHGIHLRNTAMTAMSVFSPLLRIVDCPARSKLQLQDYAATATTRR